MMHPVPAGHTMVGNPGENTEGSQSLNKEKVDFSPMPVPATHVVSIMSRRAAHIEVEVVCWVKSLGNA